MPTRNVAPTEHQGALIEMLVQSDRYQNAGEVLREGLRLVENREVEEATKFETLRAAAQLGVSALERGEIEEFPNGLPLLSHLNRIADKVVSGTGDN